MPLIPQQVYEQSTDCQRIVVAGAGENLLVPIIAEVLKFNRKKFNIIINGEGSLDADAPLVIIQDDEAANLKLYHHHIALLAGPIENEEIALIESFVDATPKSGIIIFPENDATLKKIGGKDRADVQAISYKTIPHEEKNGAITLVTSTNEKFPIHLTGKHALDLLGAAKEVLKKIGISSGQFYRGVSTIKV
ncbi:MAG: hypothetical protein ACKO96_21680 [Flammeovirgaceae bacterium]